MQRALSLQNLSFNLEAPDCDSKADLALYLRYQTTTSALSTNAFASSQSSEPKGEPRRLALNREKASQPPKLANRKCTLLVLRCSK